MHTNKAHGSSGKLLARVRGLLAWVLIGLPPQSSEAAAESDGAVLRTAPWGSWWARHPRALHGLVALALTWSIAYLTWRIGWSMQGASPVLWAGLLAAEIYGVWNLAMLAWMTWDVREHPRPEPSPGRRVDVYVCTYDEPLAVLEATLAGCAVLAYPHNTYVLDDGRRGEVATLAHGWGARYLTRPTNEHAKAGNVNHALSHTEGELVLVLDADHVPMPDALDTLVGYFDDPRIGLVQVPHDFSNHDSVQHYDLGRHEQSVFYSVICPGKDRHNAAFWCGSGALIRRAALLEVGGVATETIAEDFHTTIKLHRAGWLTRYDPRVVLQGRAPHNLAAYLLQRDRWARGNLAVFRTPESPLRARGLTLAQRLSYFASLTAYLAGPARLVVLMVLAAVLWTGALPLHIAPLALALLWAPATLLLIGAGAGLCRGQQRARETVHYELCTAEIFTRALRCALKPARSAFRVTPKQGIDPGGWEALRQFRLIVLCAALLAGGLLLRLADDVGHVSWMAHMHGFAAWFVPVLGALELRRVLRTLTLVTRHRQLRLAYRTPLDTPASVRLASLATHAAAESATEAPGLARDITPWGIGLELATPVAVGEQAKVNLQVPTVNGTAAEVTLDVAVHSCERHGELWRLGAEIVHCDPQARRQLIEYCHILWPYRRLRARQAIASAEMASAARAERRLQPALQAQS